MITVMAARLVGNVFTEGIYDIHIKARALFFLEEDDALGHIVEMHDMSVGDVMSKDPVCLPPVVRVGDVYDILASARHHCFPIVDDKDGNTFCGTIMRKVICTLIKHKAFGPSSVDTSSPRRISPLVCIYLFL